MEKTHWYKDAVIYQVWPRSFKDGNGDGIGDLWGVYEKLDYIRSLGVTAIWFNSLYPSPNADFGYDVADYMDISAEFGGMEAFRKVLEGAHQRGMRVIMDLVINHTSTEHPWFQASRRREEPYRDYYIWRRAGKDGTLPNNWDSMFEGKAWQYDEVRKEYYLHLFSTTQADLNMDNPKVRDEVKNIMRFWLDMGVDGFREDVINMISKEPGLPSGSKFMPAVKGISHYVNGPHLHEYLAEFKTVLDRYDCVAIGETPMLRAGKAGEFVAEGSGELNMVIPFQPLESDCFLTDYVHHRFSLIKQKFLWNQWQQALHGKGWNSLYIENHDHPRAISRYGSEKYRTESGKALCAAYLFQQGTPFIYQGQEIGMSNLRLKSIDLYEDVSSRNNYHNYHLRESEEKRLRRIWDSSRDSARTPMQWSAAEHAGFSESKPWFCVNPNYRRVNVEDQEQDPDSLLNFYRDAIAWRTQLPAVRYGSFHVFSPLHRRLLMYERRSKGQRILVICSFTSSPVHVRAPKGYVLSKGKLILSSHGNYLDNNGFTTQPYETRIYLFQDRRRIAEQ